MTLSLSEAELARLTQVVKAARPRVEALGFSTGRALCDELLEAFGRCAHGPADRADLAWTAITGADDPMGEVETWWRLQGRPFYVRWLGEMYWLAKAAGKTPSSAMVLAQALGHGDTLREQLEALSQSGPSSEVRAWASQELRT